MFHAFNIILSRDVTQILDCYGIFEWPHTVFLFDEWMFWLTHRDVHYYSAYQSIPSDAWNERGATILTPSSISVNFWPYYQSTGILFTSKHRIPLQRCGISVILLNHYIWTNLKFNWKVGFQIASEISRFLDSYSLLWYISREEVPIAVSISKSFIRRLNQLMRKFRSKRFGISDVSCTGWRVSIK